MDDIVLIGGQSNLDSLAWYLRQIAEGIDNGDVYEVRACVDEGALKLKANNRTWSPPLGQLERRT